MRLVFDTAMVVAAVRSESGASRRLIMAGLRREVTVLASVPLMIEYEAVLNRQEHLDAAGLTTTDVTILLDAFAAVAEPVRLAFLWRPALRDPNDDMVLETAVNGRADAIVSFNIRDFHGVARTFGMEILPPAGALKRLETGR